MGAQDRPLGGAVGQGRLRRRRAGEVRPARPRHARGTAPLRGPGRGDHGRTGGAVAAHPDRPGGLRDAVAGGRGGCVPGRVPGPARDPATAEAPDLLRPRRRGVAHPARPDPGRLGAPLHPATQRRGGGHLRPSLPGTGAGTDPGYPAVPGTAHAARRRRRGVQPGRGGHPAPRHGLEALAGEDGGDAVPVPRRMRRAQRPGR